MAAWTRRVLVGVVLTAMVAGLTPAASAQSVPGGKELAVGSEPETFVPGPINTRPVGAPVPTETGELLGGDQAEPRGERRELVERRTEDSETFDVGGGVLETTFYDGAVNYRDEAGAWQRIDPTLVPAAGGGAAVRTKAGPVAVELPAVLGAAPVRVSSKEASVSFTLRGAKGAPQVGVPAAAGLAAPPEVARASATYADALPGVSVTYVANNEGVKEELVLADAGAQASFDFDVSLSDGLSAVETPEGGISIVNGQGAEQTTFAPPFAYDQTYAKEAATSGYTTEAVSLSIVEDSPGLVVRLTADPAWLADPTRVYPVVIDPTVRYVGTNADTTIRKAAPDTNYGSDSLLALKGGSDAHRILYREELFEEPVNVLAAEVQLVMAVDTSASAKAEVSIHEMGAEWSSSQATWNQRKTGVNWATPGGDVRSPAVATVADATGAANIAIEFPMREAVQAWVDGERLNHGVMIKYTDDTVTAAPLSFVSVNNSTVYRPRTVVVYTELRGVREPYSYEELDLGAAGTASVNLGNGNLTLSDRDLSIAGTGLDATLDRFYNSEPGTLDAYSGSVGSRWTMWPQSEERLYFAIDGLAAIYANNGDIKWQGGPDGLVVFSKRPDGSYISPHGYRATLSLVTEAGAQVFKLVLHDSGLTYSFYGSGYVRDITDRNGNTITFAYTYDDASSQYFMASMTDTQGRVTTFERIGEHQVSKVSDPAGRVHTYAYTTSSGSPVLARYTDPSGAITSYEYTDPSLLTKVTDPVGNVTTFTYDSERRASTLTRSGATWRFDYSVAGQTKVTDPRGNATTHHHDGRGRVTKVIDALGHERAATYDANSNVVDRTSAMADKTLNTFDANNNLASSTLPTGAKTTLGYSDAAHKYSPTKVTNAQGNAWTMTYDAAGNLASVTDSMPTPGRSSLTYNANGTLASSTDAKGAVTTFGYDAKGNRTRVSPPAPLGATTIAYDGLSRPTSTTDGKGQLTTTAYDALDRPTRVDAGGVVVTSRYDAGGRLVERADPTGTTTFAYDAQNRVVEERLPGARTNAYTYDAVGNLTSMSDATGKVSYGYNAVNLATSVVEPGGFTTTFAYDDDDNRTTTTYPNGVTQRAAYDASDRLTSIEGTKGTTVLTRFAYTYAASGADTALRQSVTDKDNKTTAYAYDALDRLLQAKGTSSSGATLDDFRYAWDAVGNRTSETVRQSGVLGTSDVTTNATFNAADQLTNRGDVSYSYDTNGNQTASSAGQALAYNGADQTTSAKRAGGSALSATYAGVGQSERATAGNTTFTNTLLGVSAGSEAGLLGSTTGYTRDPAGALVGMRGANRSYYLFDGLGSVVAVTNASGSVTNSYTYDPFGVTTETKATLTNVINPWRYTGQYQDLSTGMYKMGARYYQPELGRWTQPDPSGLDANAYAYVGGNPVTFIDPTGQHYVDFNVGIGPLTFGVAVNSNADGSIGDVHPYAGVNASVPPISGSGSVGTGQADGGGCAQLSAYLGYGGGVGACTSTGPFAEGGVGSPQVGISAFWVL